MNSATGNGGSFFCKRQSLDQEFQQIHIHFLIINKTNKFSFAPVLQPLFNFFHQGGGQIIVNIDFGIFGNFKNPGAITFITEITEDIFQVIPDHIFQQNDMMFVGGRGRQDNKAAQKRLGISISGKFFFFLFGRFSGKNHSEIK